MDVATADVAIGSGGIVSGGIIGGKPGGRIGGIPGGHRWWHSMDGGGGRFTPCLTATAVDATKSSPDADEHG